MLPVFYSWRVSPPWDKTGVGDYFSSVKDVFSLDGEIISKGPQSEIFCHQVDGKPYFVKRYFRSRGFGSWIGFSRLRVEARNQHWFNQMGIAAARVVVYGEHYFLLKTIKGILITEGIENVTDLVSIVKDEPEKFNNASWSSSVIVDLAKVIRTLHQNRFCHNDLHWRNILVQQSEKNAVPKIYLIDCPSGKRLFWPLLHYRQIKDLASLDKLAPRYLSRTQRLRFFLEYRKITSLSSKDKAMIDEIFTHKANRLKRKAERAES